ncbi:hypothetical protein QCE62_22420 [Caballeronia sp. LZ033]|uniref:hypothetical protein n=1 Tax=Caballeronia sp. LZ033 TaxID=3038566 RepID=UPI002857B27F|nr:hypothetical protein [Caballeronia sp. LZ033]MDR5816353.1 hypothetical protein [Caballeronia sp. LZ033]
MRDNLSPVIAGPAGTSAIPEQHTRSILFAGGTSTRTIAGIARRLAVAGQRFELHHFLQSADRSAQHDEIDALRHHGKVHRHVDLPHALFEQACTHALSPARANTQIYCSGPPAFMDFIAHHARDWVYAANIHRVGPGARALQSKST